MKAIVLLFTFTVFQITSLFGNTIGEPAISTASATANCTECIFLTPSVPMVAGYEDARELNQLLEGEFLTPQVPMTADFADTVSFFTSETSRLSPEVPLEADFDSVL